MSRYLYLPLKSEYFDAIKRGEKKFEYRISTPYWTKRLAGRSFDGIWLTKGYPKVGDTVRWLKRPWLGCNVVEITHQHFGPNPVKVYAIKVNA